MLPVQAAAPLSTKLVVYISAGSSNTIFATTADGLLYAWGISNKGQTGTSLSVSNVSPLLVNVNGEFVRYAFSGSAVPSTGGSPYKPDYFSHSLAITDSNTLYAWGSNTWGELGIGTNTQANAPVRYNLNYPMRQVVSATAGYSHTLVVYMGVSCYGILADEPSVCGYRGQCISQDTCVCPTGYTTAADCTIFSCFGILFNQTGVCLGEGTCIAADTCVCNTQYAGSQCQNKVFGEVYAVGLQNVFQLGDDGLVSSLVPVQTTGYLLSKFVTSVDAGSMFSLSLSSDGILYSWGDNSYGEAGDGNTQNPRQKPYGAASNIAIMCAGWFHVVATAGNNILYGFGNGYGGNNGCGLGDICAVCLINFISII